jgi:hypothetical protein
MSTTQDQAVADDEIVPEEDLAAVLSPAQRDILAGIGAGDLELAATLLESLPEGTASLLMTYGVITTDRGLTEFGTKFAGQIAFEQGMAPQPSVRARAAGALETLIAGGR